MGNVHWGFDVRLLEMPDELVHIRENKAAAGIILAEIELETGKVVAEAISIGSAGHELGRH